MDTQLEWFNRVYDALQDEESYHGDFYELFEELEEECSFRKHLGQKHPAIELFNIFTDESVVQVFFDPYNQQFYLPSFDETILTKMHVLIDDFDDIQKIFCGAWVSHQKEYYEDDEDEMDPEEASAFFEHMQALTNGKQSPFPSFLMEEQHEQQLMQEKAESIEWFAEEKILSSVKIDVPISQEKQTVMRLGIIPSTGERVLCKERRFIENDEITHGSSQIFMISQDELIVLKELIERIFID